jgi:uncharacterized protein (DUF433 family)
MRAKSVGLIDHRGRFNGSRLSVHDVYYYLQAGRSSEEIAAILGLSVDQLECARDYIREHAEAVRAAFEKVEDRIAQGNAPDVEAKRLQSRAKAEAWLKKRAGETL